MPLDTLMFLVPSSSAGRYHQSGGHRWAQVSEVLWSASYIPDHDGTISCRLTDREKEQHATYPCHTERQVRDSCPASWRLTLLPYPLRTGPARGLYYSSRPYVARLYNLDIVDISADSDSPWGILLLFFFRQPFSPPISVALRAQDTSIMQGAVSSSLGLHCSSTETITHCRRFLNDHRNSLWFPNSNKRRWPTLLCF